MDLGVILVKEGARITIDIGAKNLLKFYRSQ